MISQYEHDRANEMYFKTGHVPTSYMDKVLGDQSKMIGPYNNLKKEIKLWDTTETDLVDWENSLPDNRIRVKLFDRGPNSQYLERFIIEDPNGGDPSVGAFGEMLDQCYVPPVMPEFWE